MRRKRLTWTRRYGVTIVTTVLIALFVLQLFR